MASIAQTSKPIQQTTNKQLLQELCIQANQEAASSVLLVKRIMAMTLSNITYLRLVFNDDCYLATPYDDKTMMMLNENAESRGVQQHVKWLSGAFHALDRQYLKSLIYAFYTDVDDPEGSTVEMYKLNVVYSQKVSLSTKDPESDATEESKKYLRERRRARILVDAWYRVRRPSKQNKNHV
jgi:hypothetical protein